MKKTYLLMFVFLLLIGVRSMAMLQQARNWLNQRLSSRVGTAARVVTTSNAKDNQQKKLYTPYEEYRRQQTTSIEPEQTSALKEFTSALSAYAAYLFGYAAPIVTTINKGTQNDINERLNRKNLGPIHKPVDYNDQK